MKKNRMLRLASVLLVSVLLTTSVISGTFAKYVTTDTVTDTARVAKWGVTIAANGTMFASSYKNDAAIGLTAVGKGESVKADPVTSSNAELVAPGTSGTLASSTIEGTPEVAVHVGYEAALTLENWTVTENGTSKEYCPLIFTVGDKTYGMTGMKTSTGADPTNESASISELQSAVKAAIEGFSKEYAPNTDLSQKGADALGVSWEWAFDENTDAKDTALGNATTPATVKLELTITVTQID